MRRCVVLLRFCRYSSGYVLLLLLPNGRTTGFYSIGFRVIDRRDSCADSVPLRANNFCRLIRIIEFGYNNLTKRTIFDGCRKIGRQIENNLLVFKKQLLLVMYNQQNDFMKI